MAAFKIVKGANDAERIASADGLLYSLDRKVAALEGRIAQEAQVPNSWKADLDEVKGVVKAILNHLGLEAQPNTTTHDLVAKQEG